VAAGEPLTPRAAPCHPVVTRGRADPVPLVRQLVMSLPAKRAHPARKKTTAYDAAR
jgi:hypothetical protein